MTLGPIDCNSLYYNDYGGGGIRTHESLRTPVFKTGALNRSATPPSRSNVRATALFPHLPHHPQARGGVLFQNSAQAEGLNYQQVCSLTAVPLSDDPPR